MPLVRKPTPAEGATAQKAGTPSPAWAANRIRNVFLRDLDSAKATQSKLFRLVSRHGRRKIKAALGADGKDLGATYTALKTYIETLDPTANVPDLPTQ